ncbi:DUF3489 domain-containing protein [Sphingomonas prati]|uniref:DUF3489 domain-containing protein n=1 Tax=Sphingomonas prati TaxID=1843237 RepID=A0A7W9BVT9_9SPHN|nr:DUF3489 domain-containing protein [Sphingomonas prati]MBB5730930.1 hypothetical protein [Sphingomonas prati]GGE97900.1 hypothetical protein GCM10011404_33810 [Sphingomonas prati]
MARLFKLTELQLILLAAAAQRSDGSLLPLPEQVSDQGVRIRKAIPPLLKHVLVEETSVTDPNCRWRQDGDTCLGLHITSAGRVRIAVDETETAPEAPVTTDVPASAGTAVVTETILPATPPGSKIAMVAQLLRRDDGASLDELVQVTGWLPHTTRAALTGLRKKGHAIIRSGETGATRYHLAA